MSTAEIMVSLVQETLREEARRALTPELVEKTLREEARKKADVFTMEEMQTRLSSPSRRATVEACRRLGIRMTWISARKRVVRVEHFTEWLDARAEDGKNVQREILRRRAA